MEQTDRGLTGYLVLSVFLGIVLSRLSLGSVVMTIPLLLVCPRLKRISVKVASFAAILAGTVVWTVVQNRLILGTEYWPALLVSLFLPVCFTVGSAVWAIGADYSSSSMRKFFWASIPVFCMGLALGFYFASGKSQQVRELLAANVMYYFPSDMLSVDIGPMVKRVIDSMGLVFAPVGVLLLAVPVVMSDVNLHRFDEEWQYDFANMKLPDSYVWVFFGSWGLALVCKLVKGMPSWAMVLAWNLALTMTVLYFIVGVSILVAFARRRTAAITAGRIVFTVALVCFIPFLNLVAAVGLPILGILETWIKFR